MSTVDVSPMRPRTVQYSPFDSLTLRPLSSNHAIRLEICSLVDIMTHYEIEIRQDASVIRVFSHGKERKLVIYPYMLMQLPLGVLLDKFG